MITFRESGWRIYENSLYCFSQLSSYFKIKSVNYKKRKIRFYPFVAYLGVQCEIQTQFYLLPNSCADVPVSLCDLRCSFILSFYNYCLSLDVLFSSIGRYVCPHIIPYNCFYSSLYFSRAVLESQQNWMRSRKFSLTPTALTGLN